MCTAIPTMSSPHDVGKQHSGQHAVLFGPGPHAGEELFDLVDGRVGILGPPDHVLAW
jgi:hypothetical protein